MKKEISQGVVFAVVGIFTSFTPLVMAQTMQQPPAGGGMQQGMGQGGMMPMPPSGQSRMVQGQTMGQGTMMGGGMGDGMGNMGGNMGMMGIPPKAMKAMDRARSLYNRAVNLESPYAEPLEYVVELLDGLRSGEPDEEDFVDVQSALDDVRAVNFKHKSKAGQKLEKDVKRWLVDMDAALASGKEMMSSAKQMEAEVEELQKGMMKKQMEQGKAMIQQQKANLEKMGTDRGMDSMQSQGNFKQPGPTGTYSNGRDINGMYPGGPQGNPMGQYGEMNKGRMGDMMGNRMWGQNQGSMTSGMLTDRAGFMAKSKEMGGASYDEAAAGRAFDQMQAGNGQGSMMGQNQMPSGQSYPMPPTGSGMYGGMTGMGNMGTMPSGNMPYSPMPSGMMMPPPSGSAMPAPIMTAPMPAPTGGSVISTIGWLLGGLFGK